MGNKEMKTSQPEGEITFPSTDLKSNTAGVQSSRPPDDRIRHRARAGCRTPRGRDASLSCKARFTAHRGFCVFE